MAAACALAFVATASGSSAAISNLAPPTRAHVDHVDAPFSLDARLVASLASRVGNDTSPGDALPGCGRVNLASRASRVARARFHARVSRRPSVARQPPLRRSSASSPSLVSLLSHFCTASPSRAKDPCVGATM